MSKPIIALKVRPGRFDDISTLARAVYESMTGNANFINPRPSLATVKTATDEMSVAMTNWGTAGHRGSHLDYVVLQEKSVILHNLLTQLGKWCMTVIDPNLSDLEQEAILTSSGFPLRSKAKPQGMFAQVQNFRRVVPPNLELTQVKLSWKKPIGVAVNTNIKFYHVFRNSKRDFFTASIIATITPTKYIDEPGAGTWYYWVAAVNSKGAGVTSNDVEVKIGVM